MNILYGFVVALWVFAFIAATYRPLGIWVYTLYISIINELRNFVTRNLFSDDELQTR